MSKSRKFITISVSGVIFISLIILFTIRLNGNNIKEVKVSIASLRDINNVVASTGSIEAEARVKISSKIKGRLDEFNFNELDYVEKGDIIAKLDDSELVAKLNQTNAGLVQAKTDLANAAIMLNRAKDLFGKKIASTQELDDAQMLFDIKEAQVVQHEATVEAIKAELEDTVITSPISGTIIRKYVEVGEMVGLLTVGQAPIVEIAKLDSFEAHTDVDETDIGKIRDGMPAEIMVDAYPDIALDGNVKEIALLSLARKETGINYVVKVRINNKDKVPLRLGMTANVNFIVESKSKALSLPLWSVIQGDDEDYVYVVNNNKLRKTKVTTGLMSEEFVEIVSGLKAGDVVLKSNLSELHEGLKVKVVNLDE